MKYLQVTSASMNKHYECNVRKTIRGINKKKTQKIAVFLFLFFYKSCSKNDVMIYKMEYIQCIMYIFIRLYT